MESLKKVIGNENKKSQYPSEFKKNNNSITGNKNIAEEFNNFFVNIGPQLARGITKCKENCMQYLSREHEGSMFLEPVTETEVFNVVNKFTNKTSKGYDDIDMTLLKNVIHVILYPIVLMCNKSLESGVFPDSMKTAKVIPLFKKGDPQDFSNYRPVSLLPQFSKILEKVFNNRLMSFVDSHSILNNGQYGFRNGHSTSSAILELLEELTNGIEKSKSTIGVFIDLKKAFDTIDHNILIKKLEFYGIRGIANDWICSYLSNRFQHVLINDCCSSNLKITCGIPQGSIIGPTLFILYINDICNVSSILKLILFADDTNIFYSGKDVNNVCHIMTEELRKINVWFMVNKLSLNVSKTNYMLFGNNRNMVDCSIYINNIEIERVYVTKFLGLHIDCKLDWKVHIQNVKNKIAKNCAILTKVRHKLNDAAMYTLYMSFIVPYLNYCCEIWGNNYVSRTKPLFLLQKRQFVL